MSNQLCSSHAWIRRISPSPAWLHHSSSDANVRWLHSWAPPSWPLSMDPQHLKLHAQVMTMAQPVAQWGQLFCPIEVASGCLKPNSLQSYGQEGFHWSFGHTCTVQPWPQPVSERSGSVPPPTMKNRSGSPGHWEKTEFMRFNVLTNQGWETMLKPTGERPNGSPTISS